MGADAQVLLLGCDGLWDAMSAEDAWEIVQRSGKKGRVWDLELAARALTRAAIEKGSSDNVSVVLVQLRR
jgi:serine/threonine protein phosphatase PrpC